MDRRHFINAALAAAAGTAAGPGQPSAAQTGGKPKPEYYELRLYHLRRGPKVKLVNDFFRDVALPAMRRQGIGPVGVFDVTFGPDNPTLYMLIPHPSAEACATASARVNADAEYRKAGADFINRPAADPAYIRVESSLMVAFDGMPRLEVPAGAAQNKPRIFELRIYESHNKAANKKKIEMFNIGEIAIFRRTGLQPVFFGETLIGTRLPNLTYLLVFDDLEARTKNWARFAADPEWKTLSAKPGYTDAEIVSNISNVILRPAAYSQI